MTVAELPPNSTTITTPIFLGPAGDISSDGLNNESVGEIVFLKFKIPDIANVVSIDSFDFFVTVYDDDDGGGESDAIFADVTKLKPGANVQFLAGVDRDGRKTLNTRENGCAPSSGSGSGE